ncbi:hypothetical protein LSAT2_032303 [Lamellibrachia satsuma]|nr:hypothetical protein LSAT2_032303 [Lamellibrachia satsuma]
MTEQLRANQQDLAQLQQTKSDIEKKLTETELVAAEQTYRFGETQQELATIKDEKAKLESQLQETSSTLLEATLSNEKLAANFDETEKLYVQKIEHLQEELQSAQQQLVKETATCVELRASLNKAHNNIEDLKCAKDMLTLERTEARNRCQDLDLQRAETEKRAFREELERMMGMVEVNALMCIVGDFNGHVDTAEMGEEESVRGIGWGTRNRESRELVELVMRNGLAVAGTFFKKQENHKISYRNGQHKTELDLLVVRRQQMWRVKDCKIIAGEHVVSQHKPLVFVVCMQKRREDKVVGQKTIRWWKCSGDTAVAYKERLTLDYEKLRTVEEELKAFKDAFVDIAEELCGRMSGKRGSSARRKPKRGGQKK